MNPPANFSSYLLPSVFNPRYHQHLNHLNDMAFTHTKMLQEIIEKRSGDSASSASSSSSTSVSPTAATSNDSVHKPKRSHGYLDTNNNEEHLQKEFQAKRSKIDADDDENQLSKRSRKQSKPQQVLKENNPTDDDDDNNDHQSVSSEEHKPHEQDAEEEEEMGEINSRNEKQHTLPTPQPPQLPFGPHTLPFLSYIQDLARTNNINSPVSMAQFLENLQKELFSAVHSAGALEAKRIPRPPPPPGPPLPPSLPAFSQTVHHHHHPYFSQILFNNSFINHYPPPPLPSAPSLMRFNHLPSDRPFPFHVSTPKKRRTKVTDTRLSPRIASKATHQDDLFDDDRSSSDHSFESSASNHQSMPPPTSSSSTTEYNAFQISIRLMNDLFSRSLLSASTKLMFFYTRYPNSPVLKVYFADVRFNKLITAQLVKWFSNFREFFYIQIEKYARQYLAEGVRRVEDLIITTDSDLYRVLNLHYNRSNQIEVPVSFCNVVQATLREFFHAIQQQKDLEPSWKKSIYKVIQRLEDQIPDFFKDERWMHTI